MIRINAQVIIPPHLQNKLNEILETGMVRMNDILHESAQEIYSLSQEQVPVDTGALKNSGQVTGKIVKDGGDFWEISYGVSYGSDYGQVHYAYIVHEGCGQHYHIGPRRYLTIPAEYVINARTIPMIESLFDWEE